MNRLEPNGTPRFAPGVRLHRDKAREQWVILAPERVIELDPIAHAIVALCDGQRSIALIVEQLARDYAADADEVRNDVLTLLGELIAKRVLRA